MKAKAYATQSPTTPLAPFTIADGSVIGSLITVHHQPRGGGSPGHRLATVLDSRDGVE